jgi:metal-sulfur cluster biosynthetic enzyme
MTGTGSGDRTEQTVPEASSESVDTSQADPLSEDQVKLALRRVKDPELNLNIMDLGLVYGIRVDGSTVNVDMTLTSPACPSGPEIVANVEKELRELDGVEQVQTNIVWTPFWTPERIEPRVRAYLGL